MITISLDDGSAHDLTESQVLALTRVLSEKTEFMAAAVAVARIALALDAGQEGIRLDEFDSRALLAAELLPAGGRDC